MAAAVLGAALAPLPPPTRCPSFARWRPQPLRWPRSSAEGPPPRPARTAATAAAASGAAAAVCARRRGHQARAVRGRAAAAAAVAGAAGDAASPLQRLEELRREDPDADRVWAAYCERKGAGRLGPEEHDTAFVERFVSLFGGERCTEDVVAQLIPLVSGDTNTAARWKSYCLEEGIGVDDPRMLSKEFVVSFVEAHVDMVRDDMYVEDLLARVKAMTAADAEAAELWSAYGSRLPDGPPTAGSVQAFLGHYAPGRASPEAAARLAALLEGSPAAHFAWGGYCRQEGIGIFDPAMLPAYFVDRFLQAVDAGCLPAVEMATEGLAASVRQVRAEDARGEDAWASYCREEGHDSLDPLCYSKEFVEAFLAKRTAGTA
ncbi:unnamed protein product [Prorocentrum cordatum]|uniref:Selenoprotein O n=1 Tax=Prorocentrum cordatum TaxID=2364126 RepID=A0ABN9TZ74_9DINO|nr:unnamed protein product [Polarella glacialis]